MRAASRKNVNQLFQLREYAKLEELRCRATFKDECSARDEEEGSERPGFKAACALALKKERAILVVDASRFSRTEESYDRFVRAGGKVYDLRGFGEDEAWMRSRIKFAKRDGDIRSRKTLEGQAKAKAAGKIFGSPYLDKAREASAASRTMDALIRRREFERLVEAAEKEGMTTPEAIAGWLNKKGYSTTKGKRWAASNVRRMLREGSRARSPPTELLARLEATSLRRRRNLYDRPKTNV